MLNDGNPPDNWNTLLETVKAENSRLNQMTGKNDI